MTPAAAELHTPESVFAPARESPIDVTIFVSCYNEEPYIIQTLETVRAALCRGWTGRIAKSLSLTTAQPTIPPIWWQTISARIQTNGFCFAETNAIRDWRRTISMQRLSAKANTTADLRR